MCNFLRFYTVGILLSMYSLSLFAEVEMDKDIPIGWATYPKYGIENTIGGGNGEVVTVTTTAELKDYALRKEPYVIIADGNFSGMITVSTNKTFIGAGSGASLKGGFFMWKEKKGNNVIIRNWKITGGNPNAPIPYMEDGITICEVNHVWVDHCDLYSCKDGLLDITQAADLVSVSWTKLHNHNKVMLIQNGHEREDEVDKLNTTLHHLHFYSSTQRHPRIGYSDAHILNCYYNGCSSYAIHLHWECRVRIQGCYFSNTGDKISQHKPGAGKTAKLGLNWDGYAVLMDNFPESGYGVKSATDPEKIFDVEKIYMYDFIVDETKNVPDIVSGGSGTGEQWSKLGAIPTPGQGAANTFKNPVLKWTKYGSKPSSKVYFGKTKNPPEVKTVNGYEYQPGMLEENTVYYWKINDGKLWTFKTGTKVNQNTDTSSSTKASKTRPAIKPFITKTSSGLMLTNPSSSRISVSAFSIKGQSILPITVIESGKHLRLPSVSSLIYIKVRGPGIMTKDYIYVP